MMTGIHAPMGRMLGQKQGAPSSYPYSKNVRDGETILLEWNVPQIVWRWKANGNVQVGDINLNVKDIMTPGGGQVTVEIWKNGQLMDGGLLKLGDNEPGGSVDLAKSDLVEIRLVVRDGNTATTRVDDVWVMFSVTPKR